VAREYKISLRLHARIKAEARSSKKLPRLRRKLARRRVQVSRLCCDLDLTSRQFEHLGALVRGAGQQARAAKAAVHAAQEAVDRKKRRKANDHDQKLELRRANRRVAEFEGQWHVRLSELERAHSQMCAGDYAASCARDEMVRSNLRLVVSIAKKYTG